MYIISMYRYMPYLTNTNAHLSLLLQAFHFLLPSCLKQEGFRRMDGIE